MVSDDDYRWHYVSDNVCSPYPDSDQWICPRLHVQIMHDSHDLCLVFEHRVRLRAERALLNHQRHNLVQNISCCHGRVLGVRVIRRRNLRSGQICPYRGMWLGDLWKVLTSTMSAATKFSDSRPRRMVRISRVDQPPVSGVPVAGATSQSAHLLCRKGAPYTPDRECRCRCSGTRARRRRASGCAR